MICTFKIYHSLQYAEKNMPYSIKQQGFNSDFAHASMLEEISTADYVLHVFHCEPLDLKFKDTRFSAFQTYYSLHPIHNLFIPSCCQ